MKTKQCARCKLDTELSNFSKDKSKKDGLGSYCEKCRVEKKAEYYRKNKERLREYSRDYHRKYNTTEEYKEKRREYHKTRVVDLEKRRTQHKERYKADPVYSTNHKLRSMLKRCLKLSGAPKSHPTFESIGYTSEQLMGRMEVQFRDGMSWSNYGEWEIDHKIPMSMMINRGETRPHIVNALANLQPLWRYDNRSKGDRYAG